MLLIDGVRYYEWIPQDEVKEFQPIIAEHAKDIFGERAEYFEKHKLESELGKGSVPDGFVISFGDPPCWHVVEVELSSHDLHRHIVEQHSRFIIGIKNPRTRNRIVDRIYKEICDNGLLKSEVREAIKSDEIHRFLSDIIVQPPILTIIIEKHKPELDDALSTLSRSDISDIKVVEFRTFTREGCGLSVHAHLFEPLYSVVAPTHTIVSERPKSSPATIEIIRQGSLEVIVRTPTCINYHLFYIPKPSRRFFPGYEVPFKLVTDLGEIETYVTSARAGTPVGDPDAGTYIQAKLAEWYRRHPMIKVGDKVMFEVIEPMKRYRLRKV